jgi:ADP-heptose:LPS heptosyltransferase
LLANELISELGAAATAGFHPRWERCPNGPAFLAYPDDEPEIRRHLALMDLIGAPSQGEDIDFPLYPEDARKAKLLLDDHGVQEDPYICMHVGGISGGRWPVDRFAYVAEGLASKGIRVVLTGVAEERDQAARVTEGVPSAANLCGLMSLGAYGAVIAGARLVVCNDTSASHLATARAVPSIVITRSDDRRWAPLDGERHRVVLHNTDSPLDPDAVLQEAMHLLDRHEASLTPALQ